MTHEIVDQTAILRDLARAPAVGDAGGLHHRPVVAHIVDDADEAVVEHRNRLIENLLERRHARPARLAQAGAEGVDFGLLLPA